jgi:hypothetical protein
MQPHEISLLIDRARRAYLRRQEYDGCAPRIADCDIVHRQGRDFIELRDGEVLIAIYGIRKGGDLRFMPRGKYEARQKH